MTHLTVGLVFIYISRYPVGYTRFFFGAISRILLSRQMGMSERLPELVSSATFFKINIFKRDGKKY